MRKLLITLCAALALVACGEEKSNKPVVRIGATLPLTGSLAETAVSAQAAMNMALKKWESVDTKYKYEILFENDMSETKQAVLNTQNFIKTKKVNAVLSIYGIVDRSVDDIANKNQVISLSCSQGKLQVPEYAINNCTQNEQIEKILIPKLKKEGIKSVALVMPDTAVGHIVGDYFNEKLPTHGIKVVAYEKYTMDTRDMRASILKMETANPDYYLTFAISPLLDVFVKQHREVTGKRNVTSLGTFHEMQPDTYKYVEDLWTIYITAGTDQFEKEFTETNNRRLKGCSASSYDNIDVLIWAFENTPVKEGNTLPDNLDVINTIKSLKNYAGAAGTLDFSDGVAKPDAQLRMYHDGKFIKITE
ncbi:MAG: ABC transporter substrate-binding protein [Alphaproteobacteria bacterium]|nr:ABC transporter substrate-binding protein [Alphaproteobacteria bacterium]